MNEVIDILTKAGAIISDSHFVGTSGLHFDTYVNKDFLYPHTKETSLVCKSFAEKFKDSNIDVVVGPAIGGIILSQWTAHHLSELCGKEVLGIYTEKSPEKGQVFTRGYDEYVKGKRILLVEDIVTTGESLLKSARAIREAGGEVVGACALVNKSKNITDKIEDISFYPLSNLFVTTYEASLCPLCKNNVPINTKVGHGKKFLENK